MSPTERLERLEKLAYILDSQWFIPIINVRVGLDALLGLIPVLGDTISLLLSAYIIYGGWRLGVPQSTVSTMIMNVVIDWAFGFIPVFGDLFDVFWRANMRNVAMIRRYADKHPLRVN